MNPDVHIHYRRLPDREEVFHQHLVHEDREVKITLARDLSFEPPVTIRDRTVLETGSEVVWFTFPGAWHDIGRFHTADDAFRGWYANIITPPTFHPGGVWHTTDLALDVWLDAEGDEPLVLDRDEFRRAVERGWIDEVTRERAEGEVASILEDFGGERWPPEVTRTWTLERARTAFRKERAAG